MLFFCQARIRLSNVVDRTDICEALRLIAASKASIQANAENETKIPRSMKILQIMKDLATEDNRRIPVADIIEHCSMFGYSSQDFEEAVDELSENNHCYYDKDCSEIVLTF